jgi:hypothetical protein
MPFGGFPVFRALRASLSEESATPLLNFRSPSGPTTHSRAARRPTTTIDSHRPRHRHFPATLLSIWCSTALEAERFLNDGVATSRRSPLVAFLRFQRTVPLRATLPTCRVCFAPATLMSFSPSRLSAARRGGCVSAALPPMPFYPHSVGSHDFEGLDPPGS